MRFSTVLIATASIVRPLERAAGPPGRREEIPRRQSPAEALRSFRLKPGLRSSWSRPSRWWSTRWPSTSAADGKLWVCEMRDYPSGIDGKWKPGRRRQGPRGHRRRRPVRHGDDLPRRAPVPDRRDGLAQGACSICAAPDILYAEDTDGDGKADVAQVLFSGFATENYQARVNSLPYGLDNWVYGANGLIGGAIRGDRRPAARSTSAAATSASGPTPARWSRPRA